MLATNSLERAKSLCNRVVITSRNTLASQTKIMHILIKKVAQTCRIIYCELWVHCTWL